MRLQHVLNKSSVDAQQLEPQGAQEEVRGNKANLLIRIVGPMS